MDRKNKLSRGKVLCVSVMHNKGGGEEFLLQLCMNIEDYDFIVASPEGEAAELFNRNGIKTLIINSLKKIYRGSGWGPYSFFKIIFNIKITTVRLLGLFRSEKPGLILANGLFAALYILPSVILTRKKFIIVQHLIFNKKSVENRVLKLIFRRTEKVVCVSEAVKNNVLSMLDKNGSNKIVIIPNGIQIPDDSIADPVDKRNIRIGMVGSIIRIKGIHLVIEALKNILTKPELSLSIYGKTSNDEDSFRYKTELSELISELGISSKIFFRGFTESRDNIYSSIDIMVNFSVIPEALPFAVLEAMAYKKIVIAADAGGSGEIINNGENGFLVKQGNLNQLKEKIEFCVENINSDLLDLVRSNAYEKVKNQYSVGRFIENYNNIFHSLIR